MTDFSDETDAIIADIRARVPEGREIVFISGNFNIIHPGHLRILNFAASCGDFLVVGVYSDGWGTALLPEAMRRDSVDAIGIVDYAFILRLAPEEFIARLRPAIVVKGREHSQHFNIEQKVVDSYCGKLLFSSGDIRFSSMDLLRNELHETHLPGIAKPTDYPERHHFSCSELIGVVRRFTELQVLVVGDLIVDEYIDCEPLGMSREDPTLVVMPIMSERFVGGAGIVAAHARRMGARVSYFAACGKDDARSFAYDKLVSYGVDCHLLVDETRPTTIKQRYRANNKTLLRVSRLRQHDLSDDLIDDTFRQMELALSQADLVIFSDFNYGCLPQPLIERIAARCQDRGTPMVADSQASSQIGDVSRFRGMKLLTPTEHEARLAMRDHQSGLVVLADALRAKARAGHILITLGAEGILIRSSDEGIGLVTDRLPAFNAAPRDVSGAGDSMLTCAAMALAVGTDIWRSAYLASVAAACQVSRVGNIPLSASELIAELSI